MSGSLHIFLCILLHKYVQPPDEVRKYLLKRISKIFYKQILPATKIIARHQDSCADISEGKRLQCGNDSSSVICC